MREQRATERVSGIWRSQRRTTRAEEVVHAHGQRVAEQQVGRLRVCYELKRLVHTRMRHQPLSSKRPHKCWPADGHPSRDETGRLGRTPLPTCQRSCRRPRRDGRLDGTHRRVGTQRWIRHVQDELVACGREPTDHVCLCHHELQGTKHASRRPSQLHIVVEAGDQ